MAVRRRPPVSAPGRTGHHGYQLSGDSGSRRQPGCAATGTPTTTCQNRLRHRRPVSSQVSSPSDDRIFGRMANELRRPSRRTTLGLSGYTAPAPNRACSTSPVAIGDRRPRPFAVRVDDRGAGSVRAFEPIRLRWRRTCRHRDRLRVMHRGFPIDAKARQSGDRHSRRFGGPRCTSGSQVIDLSTGVHHELWWIA